MNVTPSRSARSHCLWLCVVIVGGALQDEVHAQGITGVTRRTVMSPAPGLTPVPNQLGGTAPNAYGAARGQNVVATRPVVTPVIVQLPKPPPAETAAKVLAFQQQRAQAGSAQAQYDMGVRYLTGDGVEKSETEARKWLTLAAAQQHTQATKKLAELVPAKVSPDTLATAKDTSAQPAQR